MAVTGSGGNNSGSRSSSRDDFQPLEPYRGKQVRSRPFWFRVHSGDGSRTVRKNGVKRWVPPRADEDHRSPCQLHLSDRSGGKGRQGGWGRTGSTRRDNFQCTREPRKDHNRVRESPGRPVLVGRDVGSRLRTPAPNRSPSEGYAGTSDLSSGKGLVSFFDVAPDFRVVIVQTPNPTRNGSDGKTILPYG